MIFQKNKFLILGKLAVFILAIPASVEIAYADVLELPPVQVVGTNGSKCRSIRSCGLMAGIDLQIDISPPYEAPTIDHEGGGGENDVDALRCELLRAERPYGCGTIGLAGLVLNNIPSVPGFDPNWSGNGCGTGGAPNYILDFVLNLNYHDFHELNEPYQGVSFLDACNAHDLCFGTGGSNFADCNRDFYIDLNNACNGILRCEVFASAYHAAVGTNSGQNAFDNAQGDWDCAEWADLYELNRCDD